MAEDWEWALPKNVVDALNDKWKNNIIRKDNYTMANIERCERAFKHFLSVMNDNGYTGFITENPRKDKFTITFNNKDKIGVTRQFENQSVNDMTDHEFFSWLNDLAEGVVSELNLKPEILDKVEGVGINRKLEEAVYNITNLPWFKKTGHRCYFRPSPHDALVFVFEVVNLKTDTRVLSIPFGRETISNSSVEHLVTHVSDLAKEYLKIERSPISETLSVSFDISEKDEPTAVVMKSDGLICKVIRTIYGDSARELYSTLTKKEDDYDEGRTS